MTSLLFRLGGSLGVLALTACATTPPLHGPPTDPQAVYDATTQPQRAAPRLQPKALPVGPEAPYTPIMQPPVVQRVWVPDHLNASGDLVSGHWVYLLLEPSRWFLETYPAVSTPRLRMPRAPAGPAASPVDPADATSRVPEDTTAQPPADVTAQAPRAPLPTTRPPRPHTPLTRPQPPATPRRPPAASPAARPSVASLTTEQIRALQRQLAQAGWSPGPLDGALGPRTRQALRQAQRALGLPPTGAPDAMTLLALQRHLAAQVPVEEGAP
jgi:hypothetical protein